MYNVICYVALRWNWPKWTVTYEKLYWLHLTTSVISSVLTNEIVTSLYKSMFKFLFAVWTGPHIWSSYNLLIHSCLWLHFFSTYGSVLNGLFVEHMMRSVFQACSRLAHVNSALEHWTYDTYTAQNAYDTYVFYYRIQMFNLEHCLHASGRVMRFMGLERV